MEPLIGMVLLFAGNFAPVGWEICDGRLLSISQNAALFSILGTTYGGNGTTNFALPDLRGKVPIGVGQSPGGSPYTLGEQGGQEFVTLITTQIPAHNHTNSGIPASTAQGTTGVPSSSVVIAHPSPAGDGTGDKLYNTTADTTLKAGGSTGIAGGSQPHENRQPYVTINYIIATEGIYPSHP